MSLVALFSFFLYLLLFWLMLKITLESFLMASLAIIDLVCLFLMVLPLIIRLWRISWADLISYTAEDSGLYFELYARPKGVAFSSLKPRVKTLALETRADAGSRASSICDWMS